MITIKADLRGLRSLVEGFSERRYKAVIATALTRTAKIAQAEVVKEIGRVFDRPTGWALRSTFVQSANVDRQFALVWLKDRQGQAQSSDQHYLYPQVFGVRRGRKGYETALSSAGVLRSNEFTVPAKGQPLDANGNLPVNVIRSMLSQFGAAGDKPGERNLGYTSNKTNSKRSKRTVARVGTFFVPKPGGPLPRGIYQRRKTTFGWATVMILKIVVGRPQYKVRLRLQEIGQQAQRDHFQIEFNKAYDASLARLQQRSSFAR